MFVRTLAPFDGVGTALLIWKGGSDYQFALVATLPVLWEVRKTSRHFKASILF